MDLDDPLRAECLKELYELRELSKLVRSQTNEIIHKTMDELAREMTTLKAGDPRRATSSVRSFD